MRVLLFAVAIVAAVCGPLLAAPAGPAVVDSYYRSDVRFPEFDKYWRFQSSPDTLASGNIGGTLHLFVRNTSNAPLELRDTAIDGVSLGKALAFQETKKFRRFLYPANIYFSGLNEQELTRLQSAGEPAWWRFEPKTLKPGEIGELVVRVRRTPAKPVTLSVSFAGGAAVLAQISPDRAVPRMECICFGKGRDIAYLYVSHPASGARPDRVFLDGTDITKDSTFAADANASVAAIVCMLSRPLDYASLHGFQVRFTNGDKATASIRAFDDDFAYGMWGAVNGEAGQTDVAKAYLQDLALHNINVQMEQVGSDAVAEYMKSDEGLKTLASLGIRRMISEPGKGKTPNPWAFFLTDEPDAGDSKIKGLPAGSRVGTLGRGLVERTFELRAADPRTPQLLNLDYTFPPENWYTYGQIPDIVTADPYYQGHIGEETGWGEHPEKLSLFTKANYINGIAEICRSAQAPRQTNMLLFTGRPEGEKVNLRYATPQEKQIEVFYCIGAGIKGISYWWFHCLEEGLAPETADPVAQAQWREIGLLGAQLRTAGPVIMTSCPARIPVDVPANVWARALVRGNDTVVLLLINDQYTCDLRGINIKPVPDVNVTATLPGWLSAKDVFELSSGGTQDLKWDSSAGKVRLQAGAVDVTRMIFITSDQGLRARLQELYERDFAANVAKLTKP